MNEFNIFKSKVLEKKNVVFDPSIDERMPEYFDIVTLQNNTIIYRLKPYFDTDEIIKIFRKNLTMEMAIYLSDTSLVQDLNDLTLEEEKSIKEFKEIDKENQLKIINTIDRIEEEKISLEQTLLKLRRHSTYIIDKNSYKLTLKR